MNINKFIFSHVHKWVAALTSILVLTASFVMGDQCGVCNDSCCVGYLTDFGGGRVLVIDLNAGIVLQSIPTGAGPAGIAYVPIQHKMFVANQNAGTITVIDTETNLAHDIFNDPGSSPVGTTLSHDHRLLWVSLGTKNLSGPNDISSPGAIAIFDTQTEVLLKLISLVKPFSFPLDIQFSGDLTYVVDYYVNDPSLGGDLAVLETFSGNILKRIPVGNGTKPVSVAPTPDGQTLYVSGAATSRVLAVDADTGDSISIPTEAGPYKLNRTRDGKYVWSSNYIGNTVSKIDTDTNTVVATIPVAGSPFISTLSPDEKTLYSVNLDDATIAVIDTHMNVVTRIFSVGMEDVTLPIELAIVQRQPVQP